MTLPNTGHEPRIIFVATIGRPCLAWLDLLQAVQVKAFIEGGHEMAPKGERLAGLYPIRCHPMINTAGVFTKIKHVTWLLMPGGTRAVHGNIFNFI